MAREYRRARETSTDLSWLAWLMDESIQIGRWRIGLDALLGLIPGVGDIAGAAVSALIIALAIESGIPRSAVMRMVINLALDSLLGAIPFLGDIFDFAFKSNVRNAQIYREAIRGERRQSRDWVFIIFVLTILLAVLALPVLGLIYLGKLW